MTRIGLASIASLLCLVLPLSGCSSPDDGGPGQRPESVAASSDAERAEHIVSRQLASTALADAVVEEATFVIAQGSVQQSNTGVPCDSGQHFRIWLFGEFPRVETSGGPPRLPVDYIGRVPEVSAVLLKADYESGLVCQIGVRTGPVDAGARATTLALS